MQQWGWYVIRPKCNVLNVIVDGGNVSMSMIPSKWPTDKWELAVQCRMCFWWVPVSKWMVYLEQLDMWWWQRLRGLCRWRALCKRWLNQFQCCFRYITIFLRKLICIICVELSHHCACMKKNSFCFISSHLVSVSIYLFLCQSYSSHVYGDFIALWLERIFLKLLAPLGSYSHWCRRPFRDSKPR